MTSIRTKERDNLGPCAWFGPEDGPRASVRSFVVQLPPPPPSRSELQPPYQSLVAYWSKQREEREEEGKEAAVAGTACKPRREGENSAERPLIRRRLRDF